MSWQQAYQNGKNGQSFFGQGYTSMWEGMAHADGQAARAAESLPRRRPAQAVQSSPDPAYTTAAAPSRGGGGGIGRAGLGGRQKASGGLLQLGIRDWIDSRCSRQSRRHKTPEAETPAAKAYGFVCGCSDLPSGRQ